MKKLLPILFLALTLATARAVPTTLPYGLTVTGGSFTVTLTGTNTARIGTNDISTILQLVGDSGLVATNAGTRFVLSYAPAGITNNGAYISTNAGSIQSMWNNSATSTNIASATSYGAIQSGFNLGAAVASSNSVGTLQHGYFRSGLFSAFAASAARMNIDASGLNSVAVTQNLFRIEGSGDASEMSLSASEAGTSTGGIQVTVNGYGAKIMGRITSTGAGNISATNAGNGSLLLLNLVDGEAALVTGAEAIGMGAVTITNDQALVAGDGRVSHGTGSITADSFWGNGANLTNIGAASLSITTITAIASTRYESSATNFVTLTNANGTAYPVACLTNGTSGGGGGSVTLRTNPVLMVSSHPGSWAVSSDVPAGGGGSMAFELPTATAAQYRATFRSSSTATVTRTIQAPIIGLSSVATNWAWIVIDHVTSTNFLTNTVSFATIGATNALFSVTCTTSGVYWVSGTNAAGNRELVPTVTTAGGGNGSTNYGRAFMPHLYAVEQ